MREIEPVDWDQCFRKRIEQSFTYEVQNIPTAGTIHSHESTNYPSLLEKVASKGGSPTDTELFPIGIVLSVAKDYLPNQEKMNSGKQQPVQLAGEEWQPVDNLFVFHLPFGNIIGVLAESVSSARAGKYAQWLNRFFIDQRMLDKNDPNFRWGLLPVLDDETREKLDHATKLKAFTYAGSIGERIGTPSKSLKSLFSSPAREPNGIKIEIKVSLEKQELSQGDGERLLDWFSSSFGDLQGASKAQVKTVQPNGEINEVDLIQQRLTRKKEIPLGDAAVKVITARDAFNAIHGACVADFDDLYRLRSTA